MIAHAKRLLIPSLVPELFLVERGNEPGDEASCYPVYWGCMYMYFGTEYGSILGSNARAFVAQLVRASDQLAFKRLRFRCMEEYLNHKFK